VVEWWSGGVVIGYYRLVIGRIQGIQLPGHDFKDFCLVPFLYLATKSHEGTRKEGRWEVKKMGS
jgi:hypothetical protein